MPLLRTPLTIKEAPVPFRILLSPLDNVQKYVNEDTLSKGFINPFGNSHNALVQNQSRKQGPLLDSSKLNAAEHINWVVSQLPVNNTSTVLDAHTGSGVTARAIGQVAKKVVGVDISRHIIQHAQTRPSKGDVSYLVADTAALPHESNSFDVVVSRFALNQVADPIASFRELVRVTKPGGFVAVVERTPPAGLLERFRLKMEYLESVRDYTHRIFMDELQLSVLFELNGIKNRKITYSQATETLKDFFALTGTLGPDREVIESWILGNLRSDEIEFEQVTGYEPYEENEDIWVTHNQIFIGGIKE